MGWIATRAQEIFRWTFAWFDGVLKFNVSLYSEDTELYNRNINEYDCNLGDLDIGILLYIFFSVQWRNYVQKTCVWQKKRTLKKYKIVRGQK